MKLGQAEAEVEAEPDRLREAIDLVPELAAKLPKQGNGVASEGAEPLAETAVEMPGQPGSGQLPPAPRDMILRLSSAPSARSRMKAASLPVSSPR